MRPPPDSKTPLLRSSRWGGRGCWGNASRTSFMLSSLLLGGKKGALLLTALNYYSAVRSHQAVRAAGFPLPEESGGWDPSPRCRCYQACQSDSRRRLFTQVRGRGILGSPDAGSCIDRPRELRGWLLRASTLRGRGLHVVVLDGYAGRRIGTGP